MKLEKLIENLEPELKGIALKTAGQYPDFDTEDLMQEMFLFLWENLKKGKIKNCTKSYLLQGCWFHLKNYIRTSQNKLPYLSLDYTISDDENCLADTIHSNENFYDSFEFNIAVSEVMNNGLSDREKEVFSMTLAGYTFREIGEKLEVSHVMVHKILKNIKSKTYKHFF